MTNAILTAAIQKTNRGAAAVPELCISVNQSAGSITRGQPDTFSVQAWSENWAPSSSDRVTITLSAQPSGVVPAFSSTLCGAGNHTTSCTIAAPGSTHTNLQAQVPVASGESITLTAEVNPAATTLPQPPTAAETVQVIAASTSAPAPASTPASASPSASATSQSPSPSPSISTSTAPVDLPPLNGTGSSIGNSTIGAGNASGLFPPVSSSPSASPSPQPDAASQSGKENANPAANVSVLPLGMPVVTAQIIGLIALALAAMLTMTRLSLRRRPVPAGRATVGKADGSKASNASSGKEGTAKDGNP